jgi:hypothetical protein
MTNPEIKNTVFYVPDTFSLTPELMRIMVGLGMKVEYPDWGQAEFSGMGGGNIRIELDEFPPGIYTLFITYFNQT